MIVHHEKKVSSPPCQKSIVNKGWNWGPVYLRFCVLSPLHLFSIHATIVSPLSKDVMKFPLRKGQLVFQSVCSCRCGGHHAHAHRLASCLLPMRCRVSFPQNLAENGKFIFSLLSSLGTFRNIIFYETAPICHTPGWETEERKAFSHTAPCHKFLFNKSPLP